MQAPLSQARSGNLFAGVTVYHWLVVLIASASWLFDCMDQRLFILARESALKELLGNDVAALGKLRTYIGWATTSMILGWATGGIIFGVMSDKLGRVKTMVITLLVYSGFTGLSGLSQTWPDFFIYRFLVGLGVGGMFGAATTLVAESVPGNFRSMALGSLQALSALGNIIGSLTSIYIQPGATGLFGYSGWRILFFVGILPALLVVPIVFFLKEPESWRRAKLEGARAMGSKGVGSLRDLFGHPRWRRNAVIGLLLGLSGMVGLWGIGFFSPELISTALRDAPLQTNDVSAAFASALRVPTNRAARYFNEQLTPETRARLGQSQSGTGTSSLDASLITELNQLLQKTNLYQAEVFSDVPLKKGTLSLVEQVRLGAKPGDVQFLNRQLLEETFPGAVASLQSMIDKVRGQGTLLQDVGAFIGMLVFTFVASLLSRRLAFLGGFILCLGITAYVFKSLHSATDAYWMLPMMGFAQLSVFAGYSIYFPELFPTRLRGTGVGFCYNTVRYLAAITPTLMGYLASAYSFRTAALLMSSIYLVGIVALIWAPETKGTPLPED